MIRFGGIEICSTRMLIRNGDRVMNCASGSNSNGGGKEATIRFKVFKYLLCADGKGLSRGNLFDLLYGDDPEGGPNNGLNIIDVRLHQLKTQMVALGVALKRERRGGFVYYRMVPGSHVV